MPITTTDEQRRTAWIAFAKTPEYASLEPSNDNSRLLDREVRDGDAQYSCSALLQATRTLAALLDWKPVAPVPVVPAEVTEQVYSEESDPNFPRRGPLENGWAFQQRKTNYREEMAQRAWRVRENARLAQQPPAQSTISRTNAELKLRKAEQDLWNAKKAAQS
jgi:hypothetical protein